MSRIIGNTTATPNPRPDWNQTDETKADYIKNKPSILTEEDVEKIVVESGVSSDLVQNVSNALKGEASGSVVTMTDISSLEHEIKVKLSLKEVKENVSYIGNVQDNGWGEFYSGSGDYVISSVEEGISPDNGTVYFTDGSSCDCWWGLYKEDYVPSVGEIIRYDARTKEIYLVTLEGGSSVDDITAVTLTKYGKNLVDISQMLNECLVDNGDGTFSYTRASSNYHSKEFPLKLKAGTTIALHMEQISTTDDDDRLTCVFIYADGTAKSSYIGRVNATTLTAAKDIVKVQIFSYNAGTKFVFKNFQIELGETASEYEPFKEPASYTPNPDGTVDNVTSLYPTTTLLTDAEGVTIAAEYNKDTNKVISETRNVADNATTLATTAIGAADKAKNAADEAKDAAEEAARVANNADTNADNAVATAATASGTASEAKATADEAKATAENALSLIKQTANALKGSASGSTVSMTDVSPIEHEIGVKLASKNLLDLTNIKNGYELTSSGGATASSSTWYVTGWIPVEPSTTYTISGTSSLYRAEVDENFAPVVWHELAKANTFATTEKTHYVQFNSLIEGYDKPQLELGTTATEYTPFVPLEDTIGGVYFENISLSSGELLNSGLYTVKSWSYSNDEISISFEERDYIGISVYPEDLGYESGEELIADLELPKGTKLYYDADTNSLYHFTKGISSVALTKYGKNLCGVITVNSNVTINDGVVTQITADTASGWIKCVSYKKNGSYVGVLGTGTLALGVQSVVFVKDDTYDLVRFGVGGIARDTLMSFDASNLPNGTYTISGNFTNITQGSISWKDMQIEVGDTATEFESFKEPIPCEKPNADGTVEGVTSYYPTTTLVTDTDGVIISTEYNKDLNKVVNDIYQKLSALSEAVVNN